MAGYNILYVDDEPVTHRIQQHLGEDFSIIECTDEATYKRLLQQNKTIYHGAIIDYRLPRQLFPSFDSGQALTSNLHNRFPNMAIIAFSGYLHSGSEEREISEWLVAGATTSM